MVKEPLRNVERLTQLTFSRMTGAENFYGYPPRADKSRVVPDCLTTCERSQRLFEGAEHTVN